MDVATVFENFVENRFRILSNIVENRFMPNLNYSDYELSFKTVFRMSDFFIAVVDARTNMSIFSISEKTVRLIEKRSRRFRDVS